MEIIATFQRRAKVRKIFFTKIEVRIRGGKGMHRYFIASKLFEHPIDCFCPDGDHATVLPIEKGDIIELTNNRKFIMDRGWYFLVVVNNHENCFYMAIDDLEYYYSKELIFSMLDIELKLNYSQYKIDQALDEGDKQIFRQFTKQFKDLKELWDAGTGSLSQSI